MKPLLKKVPLPLMRFLLSCVFLLGASASVFAAAPDGVSIERVEVGLHGAAKIGRWTPAAVTVKSDQPRRVQLLLEAPDPDGNGVVHTSEWVTLETSAPQRLSGFFRFGRPECTVRVSVRGESGRLASRQVRISETSDAAAVRAFRQSAWLVATVGEIDGFAELDGDPYRVLALDGPGELPRRMRGYDALNTLVVAGPGRLDRPASRALRRWVGFGGQLIVCVGSRVEEYRSSLPGEWISRPSGSRSAPVPVDGTMPIRDLSDLESFADTSERIRFRQTTAARFGPMDAFDGVVLASSLDGPLLVRVAYGLGSITVLGLDPNEAPLSSWRDLPELARNLIHEAGGTGSGDSQSESARPGQLTHSGISDLASQLHAIQDEFPGIRRMSLWGVMGLFVAYLLLIGPVDYLLVHRVLRRPHLAWLTFPGIVVGAAVLTGWTAARFNGGQRHVNQLEIVDIDETSQRSRSRSWITVYSPQTRRYRVEVRPRSSRWARRDRAAAQPAEPRLCWEGLPEENFGGMYRSGGALIGGASYHGGRSGSVIEDLPVPLWSTKSLTADWHDSAGPVVDSQLKTIGAGGQLVGTLTHSLPAPIEQWILAYENRVFFPVVRGSGTTGALKPGQTWSLEEARRSGRLRQRVLSHFLAGTRRVQIDRPGGGGPEIQKERVPYDVLSRNPDAFLRILTFHEAAGGTGYTGLSNDVLRSQDLSDLLHVNRAVLLGRIDAPAAEVRIDGEAAEPGRHLTYVRIVLPVTVGPPPESLPDLERTPVPQ